MSIFLARIKRRASILSTAFALLLLLSCTMIFLPSVKAARNQTATYAFIAVNPNPVGVNQEISVNFWLSEPPTTAAQSIGDRFTNFQVTIQKPNGNTETKGPFKSDDLSAAYFSYVPDQVGTYTFTFTYPGEYFADIDANELGSTATTTLTVQTEPVTTASIYHAALPNNYWTRPVNGINYGWSEVASNWLMAAYDSTSRAFDNGCAYDPHTSAPNSAHILWAQPMTFGGLIGGGYGSSAYFSGMSYEEYLKPPVIICGRIYYNSIIAGDAHYVANFSSITAMDLETGKIIMTIPNATLSFGQIYMYSSPNEAGARAYLWEAIGSTWRMFDAWTGAWLLTYVNVPTGGTTTLGPDGSIIIYKVAFNATAGSYQLTKWNNTRVIPHPFISATNDEWTWSLYNNYGQVLNAIGNTAIRGNDGVVRNLSTNGIEYIVNLSGVPNGGTIRGQWVNGPLSDNENIWVGNGTTRTIAYTGSGTIPVIITNITDPGISFWSSFDKQGNRLSGPTKLDLTGILPPNSSGYASSNIGLGGTLTLFIKETMQFYAFNLNTGAKLWGPTKAYTDAWGMYDFQGGGKYIVNGILYNAGYDGMIHAFNATTGDELWNFYDGNAGTLLPYGTWPFYNGLTVADGKLFATTGDHGNGVTTLYAGEGLYVVDAVTGKPAWNMTGWFEQPAIADGILISHNNYDNLLYAFGKGPSATTVTVAPKISTKGTPIMIEGTITDQSPGKPGTPAISEKDMSTWMAYLYEQQQMPTDATGVTIKLTAIDPNGNSQNIATPTSDTNGNYAVTYNPPVEGMYKITATFEGSNSYGSSTATTYVYVGTAPSASAATPTPTPPPVTASPTLQPTETPSASPSPVPIPGVGPNVALYIAIVAIVIIIVVVAIALLLRRRK